MRILSIAFNNFKNNIKVYTMYFVSMVFSMIILFNFENLIYGDLIKKLDSVNSEYCSGMLKVITIILIVFMCFYIWYSSNTFLVKRKKEIGIYVFMGLDLSTIGKMYFLETMLVGLFSSLLGSGLGIVFSKFFQSIILKISDYDIKSTFEVNPKALLISFLIFTIIFLVVTVIGFINICMSKIVDLLNANKKQDFIPRTKMHTYILGVLSLTLILIGCYLSTKIISEGMVSYMFISVVLIITGTYGFFKNFMQIVLNFLIKRKSILYKGENIVTINNISYRIRKNYKVYATVTIILASTIISLSTAVSMKATYDSVENKSNMYTCLFISEKDINEKKIKDIIGSREVNYDFSANMIYINENISSNDNTSSGLYDDAIVVKYDEAIRILKTVKEDSVIEELKNNPPKKNEFVQIQRNVLASIVKRENVKMNINNNVYNITRNFNCRFLGIDKIFLIANNEDYETLKIKAKNMNFYGVKLQDESNIEPLWKELKSNIDKDVIGYTYLRSISSLRWLKFVYGIGGVLFLVFILATGSILYMKIYNDATEDKDKYKVLMKIGTEKRLIEKAITKEVLITYTIPLIMASIHSYFAVKLLSQALMHTKLTNVYVVSLVVSIIVFLLMCQLSIKSFKKIINI